MTDEYRLNAGTIVFNQQGKVWLGQRAGEHEEAWQFPQGGINTGESPKDAAIRELAEETNIRSAKIVAAYPEALRYKFSETVLDKLKKLGRNNIGQEQYWFLFYFDGDEQEINLRAHPEEIEFCDYRWVDMSEAVESVVDFKREVYRKVAQYMQPKIDEFLSRL